MIKLVKLVKGSCSQRVSVLGSLQDKKNSYIDKNIKFLVENVLRLITFACVTKMSHILEWHVYVFIHREDYISLGDQHVGKRNNVPLLLGTADKIWPLHQNAPKPHHQQTTIIWTSRISNINRSTAFSTINDVQPHIFLDRRALSTMHSLESGRFSLR